MNRPSIEQEIKHYLSHAGIRHRDHTDSYTKPDFTLWLQGDRPFFLEAKEKRQAYNLANWPTHGAPEPELFILDDLTVRKCLGYAPRAGVLVRDHLPARYFFFSIIDLALMPRQRVNRPIRRNAPDLKGKWLVNLGNARRAATLAEALTHIRVYVEALPHLLADHHACYGDYVDETISSGGVERHAGHWDDDIRNTR